ncbi:MAG TPA: hypothetical protein VMH80_20115 [Bryobacteraceae bacterium]|nr:hypothetical protein [Bryobacteraceae bacterium]
MSAANLTAVSESAVLLAGIGIVLFWFWSSVRLDCFRQEMFAIRDELFDYAASGHIMFNHPAYRLLRQSMNGFIRYGHQLSFYQFCMTWLSWKALEGTQAFDWRTKWEAALNSVDVQARRDLEAFHDRATMCVIERIVLGSPILIFALIVSLVVVLCHVGWKSVGELLRAALSETAARAIDQRILDEEAARAAA